MNGYQLKVAQHATNMYRFSEFSCRGFIGTPYATHVKILDQALVALLLAELDHIIDVRPSSTGLVFGTFQTHTALFKHAE